MADLQITALAGDRRYIPGALLGTFATGLSGSLFAQTMRCSPTRRSSGTG